MAVKWYRTDTTENAVDSLEQSARFYKARLRHKWKWFVIALHNAVYAFAICAVRGTDPTRVLRGSNLISPREALIRCQNDAYMHQYVHSTTLTMTDDEKRALGELLCWVRDNFIHFNPQLWSIEIAWLLKIVKPSARVIRFLALEAGNIRLTQTQRKRVMRALNVLDKP
jgi:hypothetical protein